MLGCIFHNNKRIMIYLPIVIYGYKSIGKLMITYKYYLLILIRKLNLHIDIIYEFHKTIFWNNRLCYLLNLGKDSIKIFHSQFSSLMRYSHRCIPQLIFGFFSFNKIHLVTFIFKRKLNV